MDAVKQKKSRRVMLLVAGAFLAPIILAKLALMQGWFNYGVTNKGSLITTELTLAQLGLAKNDFNHAFMVFEETKA